MALFDPNGPCKIINRKSGKALSASGTANGKPVILFEFVNGLGQLWYIVEVGEGGFCRFENRHSGRLLSTENRGSGNNTIIHLWEDLGTFQDQHWLIEPTEAGFVKIANRIGGRVVSCLKGGTANDTPIHLQDYLGGYPDQDWSIDPVPAYDPKVSYRIVNRKSGSDLSVEHAGSANGSRAILFHYDDAEDQRWHLVDLGNGFHKLVNNHSGRVLSTLNGESTNGTFIHIWDDLTAFHDQQWAVRHVGEDFVSLTNRVCGRAVSCLDGGVEDNTKIHLWDYLGGYPDQEWRLVPVTEHVDVDANKAIANISPYMTGVCLEDVNHEVYGGIDSQMIFGESFQEPPPYDPNALYKIVNIVNGRDGPALSVRRRGLDNGSLAIVWEFFDAPDQRWHIVDIGDGFCKLINAHGGKALSTLNGGSTNGTLIHLWDYLTTFPDQHWAIRPTGAFVRIMNRTSRRVVSRLDDGTMNNGRLQLFNFPSAPGQVWRIWPLTQPTQPDVSGMWRSLSKGSATGSYALGTGGHVEGWRTQRITFSGGSGKIGIENRSLNRWGMDIQADKTYGGYLYVRASAPTTVYVAFESASGAAVYAEASFTADAPVWARYDFTLTPSHDNPQGRFAIKLKQPGSIEICYAFVQPGAWGRFKDLPVRKDIAEALQAQGITFMRFGGSSVSLDLNYRWKNMHGPRDSRAFTGGFFYPYSTNGWAIFDFLNLAEALGVVGIPTVGIHESPAEIRAFIEYANWSVFTEQGLKRARDGHPKPYRLKYLQLGNEQEVDEAYARKFELLAREIWDRDSEIILIVGDFEYAKVITDPNNVEGAHVKNLSGHKAILALAKLHDREVWFDCHVWTENVDLGLPQEQRYDAKVLKQVEALDSLCWQLERLGTEAQFKLVVFELNADSNDMHRALANAMAIGAMQRLGDRIRMVASANALQPDDQNDNGWNQGLLFFNPRHTWAQPPYYVTQMKARHYLPRVVQAKVSGRESVTFDVTAQRSIDGTTLDLHVVNTLDVPRTYKFDLHGFDPKLLHAHVTTLAGAPGARNSAGNPHAVAPSAAEVAYARSGNSITLDFAPSSFTIVRLR